MGCDAVQIGLRHNLPVDDAFAMVQEVARRMNRNIRLVYMNRYEYDVAKNVVFDGGEPLWVELAKVEVNDSTDYLQMEVLNYQVTRILELVGIEKLRLASHKNKYGEYLLSDIQTPYGLYEISGNDIYIRILKENVDLNVNVQVGWSCFESVFTENLEWLNNFRTQIYNQAKMFGCKEVVICSDQGPGEFIYDKMDVSAEELKEYACSFQYLNDYAQINENFDVEDWKKSAKHIFLPSLFSKQVVLTDNDFIEVIYDDFSDFL
jgi:hypothetical protein